MCELNTSDSTITIQTRAAHHMNDDRRIAAAYLLFKRLIQINVKVELKQWFSYRQQKACTVRWIVTKHDHQQEH
jgi:hypothetical protein